MHHSPTYPGAGTPEGAQPPHGGTYPPPQWGPSATPLGTLPPGPWSSTPQAWWPQPFPPRLRKARSRRAVVGIVAACVLAVAVLGAAIAGAVGLGRAAGQAMTSAEAITGPAAASVQTAAPVDPAGLGSDPVFNGQAQNCHDGDMQACDDLYDNSDPMSRYEQYGMTCGGRVKPFDVDYCTDLG
jgi:hypothetical protein